MDADQLGESLATLFGELLNGAPAGGAYVLNGGDTGLLRALEGLSAKDASLARDDGATVAAHVAHLAYGLSLLNRWAAGGNPFQGADWSVAWQVSAVSESEWASIRAELRLEATRWAEALRKVRDVRGVELNGLIGSVVHMAYHLGAIRQIQPLTRGPQDPGPEGPA